MVKINNVHVFYALLGALLVVLVVNFSLSATLSDEINKNAEAAGEQARPAEIAIVKISAPDCPGCFDIENFVSQLKSQGVSVKSERALSAGSSEARQLISKYQIDKLPVAIVSGEVGKTDALKSFFSSMGEFRDSGKTFVFGRQELPYYTLGGNRVAGAVKIISLEANDCKPCVGFQSLVDALIQNNVKIAGEKRLGYNSAEGQALIRNYGIKAVPAILVSKEIDDYEKLREGWRQLNATLKGDYYAFSAIFPPYIDLSANKTVGLVSVIYLNDSGCAQCYDVKFHNRILLNFGLQPYEEKEVDISSAYGKELLARYNIKSVPTILLSPETAYYKQLDSAWYQVGTKANDSWYVFRNLSVPGLFPYKNLATNALVNNSTGTG